MLLLLLLLRSVVLRSWTILLRDIERVAGAMILRVRRAAQR